MTVSLISGSSVALTTGTETTLAIVGRQGRFQLVADLSNYLAGDEIDLRIYLMATPTGTARVLEYAGYMGAQPTDDMVKLSSVIPNDQTDAQALKFTATQSRGTSRNLLWKVLDVSDEPTNWFNLLISPLGHISNVDLVGQVTGSVMSVISGTAASFDPSTVWSFTGTRSLNGIQNWNLSGTVGAVATVLDKVNYQLLNNQVVNFSGTITNVFNVLNPIAVGTVQAVQGGFVTVSGVVTAGNVTGSVFGNVNGNVLGNVNGSVNNVLQPVVASAVQGGTVTVSGSLSSPQVWNLIGNITGTIVGNISGTVGAVATVLDKVNYFLGSPQRYDRIGNTTGTTVGNISGTVGALATNLDKVSYQLAPNQLVIADVRSLVGISGTVLASAVQGLVGVSGTVVVGTNQDKTGYSLSSPQSFNLIGNISGTVTVDNALQQEIEDLVALLAQDERAVMGTVYYVDGLLGNDISGNGTRTLPFKTITRALIPVIDHNHDAIFLLPMPTGTNTITETGTVVVNKADVQIFGPGHDVLVTNIPANNRDVFSIQAEGVGIRQMRLQTTGNSSNGITFTNGSSLGLVSHVFIEAATQDGIFINVGSRNRLEFNHIQTVGRDAIRVNSGAGSGTYNSILDNTLRNNVGNGINLLGTDASDTQIRRNVIRDNIGVGVNIAAGVLNTLLVDNRIMNNTGGDLADAGTNTKQQWNWFTTDVLGIPLAVYNVVSGTSVNPAQIWSFTGARSLNGLQNWNLVGNISGSIFGNILGYVGQVTGSVMSVISGTAATFDPATVWGFTGTRSLNGNQFWNLYGFVGQVTGSVMSVVSGTTAIFDPSTVWNFTGSRALNVDQNWNLRGYVGQVTGSVMSVVSGTSVNFDPSLVWSFTGSRSLNGLQIWNLAGYVGQVTGSVMSVVSGTSASVDPSTIWNFTGSRALNVDQHWTLVGNISGTIMPPISAVATGVVIDYSQIWGFPVRTLSTPIYNLPPVSQGNNLNIMRGDTFVWSPTNLGSLANLSKLYFTIKRAFTDLDSEAEVQVEKTLGLVISNRQPAANPLNGSIVILDANFGNLTVTINASETAKWDLLTNVYYDLQFINTSGTVTTLVNGLVTIQGDATRSTGP